MPRRQSVWVTAALIATFMAINIFVQNALSEDLTIFIASVFFLVASASIVALAQGLRDRYIRKNFLLQEQLQQNLEEKALEAKRQKELANKDALTGLPNRRFITKALGQAMQHAKEEELQLVLMFLDLNGFKAINDDYGHDAGDEILKITAKRLRNSIREEDYIARLGGDEFLIGLLVQENQEYDIEIIREEIRSNVIKRVSFQGNLLKVGTSIGIARFPKDGNDIETLIQHADENMYTDKARIKGTQLQDRAATH